jgi:hypothetical protein
VVSTILREASVFLPKQSTAQLALEVSPWLALDVAARRALRRHDEKTTTPDASSAEAPWTSEDLQRACVVLAEQFIGLLAMLARRHACREAGARMVLIDPQGHFDPEFEGALARHLQFSPSHIHYAEVMQALTHDFRQWVVTRPPELVSLGLSDHGPQGVLLTCKPLPPVLTPLSE